MGAWVPGSLPSHLSFLVQLEPLVLEQDKHPPPQPPPPSQHVLSLLGLTLPRLQLPMLHCQPLHLVPAPAPASPTEFSWPLKHISPAVPGSSSSRPHAFILKVLIDSNRYLYIHIHSSISHNGQKVKPPSVHCHLDKQNMVQKSSGLFFNFTKGKKILTTW